MTLNKHVGHKVETINCDKFLIHIVSTIESKTLTTLLILLEVKTSV